MVFAKRDLNKVSGHSGGNYIELPGDYEFQIVGWKSLSTFKTKESALIVDLKVLSATPGTYQPGSIRNFYLGESNLMFDSKVKNLLTACTGLSDGLDADKIEEEDWYQVLEASVKAPSFMLLRKVRCIADYELKAEGRKKLKKNPALEDDPDFLKEYQFLKLTFLPHEETRAEVLKLAQENPNAAA